jgi:hypothetical protein
MKYGSSRPATTKCESRIGDIFSFCIAVDVTVEIVVILLSSLYVF